MSQVEAWCKTVCIVTIASGILISLMPQNKLSSAVKTLTAIILVYAIIMPITQIESGDISFDFTMSDDQKHEIENLSSSNVIDYAEEMLENEIDTLIKDIKKDSKSYVDIFEKNGVAEVERITITGDLGKKEKERITDLIQEKLQKEINIEFSG